MLFWGIWARLRASPGTFQAISPRCAQKQWLVEHFSSSARRVIRAHSRASFRPDFLWQICWKLRKLKSSNIQTCWCPDLTIFPRSSIEKLLRNVFTYWNNKQNSRIILRTLFSLKGQKMMNFIKIEKLIFWWFPGFSGLLRALPRPFRRAARKSNDS